MGIEQTLHADSVPKNGLEIHQGQGSPTVGERPYRQPYPHRSFVDSLPGVGYFKKRLAGAAIAASLALSPFIPYASVRAQDVPAQELIAEDALPIDAPSTLNVTHVITVNRDLTSDYAEGNRPFIRRDANNDGVVNIADPVYTATFLFGNGEEPLASMRQTPMPTARSTSATQSTPC